MFFEVQWLIATTLCIITIIGGVIVRDRQFLKTVTDADDKLHQRVNRVEREFVRRDDLNGHIQTIENTVNSMREEQRETNRRIDTLLTHLTNIP